jgi:hypothetical protein
LELSVSLEARKVLADLATGDQDDSITTMASQAIKRTKSSE